MMKYFEEGHALEFHEFVTKSEPVVWQHSGIENYAQLIKKSYKSQQQPR